MAPKSIASWIAIAFLATSSSASPFPFERRANKPIKAITSNQWAALNASVNGNLHGGIPISEPCYSIYNGTATVPNAAQCANVQNNFNIDTFTVESYGGLVTPNWGTCQATGQSCLLDFNAPQNPLVYAPPNQCYQGNISPYYVEVHSVSDIQAVLAFATANQVSLSIKNSGHDYKGRSTGLNTLAIWTHKLQPALTLTKNFVPAGCSAPAGDGVTMGAGQKFLGLYQFAEANGITVVGGSSETVGASGGWISGGGHSALSNTLGLGVDNALQIKAVLPDGTFVTANRCQNQDVFFALRGGGGSTFGVITEMTTLAHPKLTLQVAYIRFASTDINSIRKYIDLLTANANKWAAEGWGGYIAPGALTKLISGMILMTPSLSHDQAVASMKPITDYVASLGNVVLNNSVDTVDSFYQAYTTYVQPNEEKTSLGISIGSRLWPQSLFSTAAGQKAAGDALQQVANTVSYPVSSQLDPRALTYGPPLQILVTAPNNYKDDGTSAVTPAWRTAVWHVTAGVGFSNQADAATIRKAFQGAHTAANILKAVAPDSGAYQNEADVFESDPASTFWGQTNYAKLLALKKKYDPKNILTCWQCIGWDSTDPRYGCYPSI